MTNVRTDEQISAQLVAGGNAYPLNLDLNSSNTLKLDSTWAPYGQADLSLAMPDDATYALLDPRTDVLPRIKLHHQVGGKVRDADLALRVRNRDYNTGGLTIAADTDECLLQDRSNVTASVDSSARARQTSLRGLINNWLLPKIDTALDGNLVPNPTALSAAAGWNGQYGTGGAGSLTYQTNGPWPDVPSFITTAARLLWSTAPTANNAALWSPQAPVKAGKTYTGSVYAAFGTGYHGPLQGYIRWYDASGAGLGTAFGDPDPDPGTTGKWVRVSITAVAPAGAAFAATGVYFGTSDTLPAVGNTLYATGAMISPGSKVLDIIDPSLAVDADVTTTYALTNLVPDPRTQSSNNVTDVAGTSTKTANNNTTANPSGKYQAATWSALPASPNWPGLWFCGTPTSPISISPGSILFVRLAVNVSIASDVSILVNQYDSTGHRLSSTQVTTANVAASTWAVLQSTFSLRAGAQSISVGVIAAPRSNTPPFTLNFSSPMVVVNPFGQYDTDGVTQLTYFDGATAADTYYTYAWDEAYDSTTTYASTSTRTPKVDRSPDSLAWSPGQSLWDLISPVVAAAGMRLFCDEQRVWRLITPDYTDVQFFINGSDSLQLAQSGKGGNLVQAGAAIDLSDEAGWFDSVIVKYSWTDANKVEQVRYDVAGTAGSTRALLIEKATPYPGPGLAALRLARQKSMGYQLALKVISDVAAHPYNKAIVELPGDHTQINAVVSAITLDLPTDTMQVTVVSAFSAGGLHT